jgi:hypothetical protein
MSKIREELEELTHIEQEENEEYQDYLGRLVDESDKVIGTCDDIWEALDEETQKWIDSGVDALNKNSAVPDFFDAVLEETDQKGVESEKEPKKEPEEKLKINITAELAKEGRTYLVDGEEVECIRKTNRSVVFETEGGDRIRKALDYDIESVLDSPKEELDSTETKKEEKKEISSKPKEQKSLTQKVTSKEKPKKKPKKISIGRRIKEIVCENLDFTEEQVDKKLKKEGHKTTPNNIRIEYANARVVIDKLRSLGKLLDE